MSAAKVEVIENPHRLSQKVRAIPGGDVDALLARVEATLQKLGGEYRRIYDEDVQRIDMHFETARQEPSQAADSIKAIRVCLHDMRGQAGTFGFDLATRIADSACKFIDMSGGRIEAKEMLVLAVHVDALKVVNTNNIKGDGGPVGKELIAGLAAVIERHATGRLNAAHFDELLSVER
jgi:chemotaxis protein histidine kinase CheA